MLNLQLMLKKLFIVILLCLPIISQAHTEAQCLANAIYHESRGEPLEGQRAVYEVVRNRAKESGKSFCNVVKSPNQFQWLDRKPFLPYTVELKLMLEKVKGHPRVLLNDEKWFFRVDSHPKWAKRMRCRVLGNHKFCYKEK